LKSQVFWDVAPGHLIVTHTAEGLKCFQLQGLRNIDCRTPNMTAL